MGRINAGRVVLGGVLAAVFLYLTEYVVQGVLMKAPWEQATRALGHDPNANMGMAMGIYAVWALLVGLAMAWVYAACRPRFGAGPVSAAKVGFTLWIVGSLAPMLGMLATGLWPPMLLCHSTLAELVLYVLAAIIAAAPYQETA